MRQRITLHYSPGSCSLAPHILLHETGVEFAINCVSVSGNQTQSDAHLARNPKGRVPVLEVEAEHYTEVPAISYWIASLRPDLDLIPKDRDRATRVFEWFNWLSGTVHAVAFGEIWRPQRFTRNSSLHPQIVKAGTENAVAAFAFIERTLEGRTWAVPGAFSVIDPYLLVFFRWGLRIGLDMRTDYPAWSNLSERIAGRSSVTKALEWEGTPLWP